MSLSTTSEVLLALPVSESVAESKKQECWDYGQVFFRKGKEAEADGNDENAAAWRILGQIAQMSLQHTNVNEPFRAIVETPDGRSMVPSDLDDNSATAVRQLAETVTDPELGARLSDVTWERLRNVDAARRAIQQYVDTSNRLLDPNHWTQYAERVERALRLARQIRDQELANFVLAEIERRIVELDGEDPKFLTCRMMRLLNEFEKGDPEVMSEIAKKAARRAEEQKDFDRAREHCKNLALWRRRANDDDGERDAKIAIAESYVSQSELFSSPGGDLAAAHFLEQAHEAYRNIGGMREKVDEIYGRLRVAQRRARSSLKEIRSDAIDLSPTIKAARQRVSGKSFREALLLFSTVTQPTDFNEERERAREMLEQFPLQSLFGGSKIDDDGRVVAHKTPGMTYDEKQAEQALWERVVEQTVMCYQLSVQGEIAPALNQINFEHSPTLLDFEDLVVNNPFVPSGHEDLFAKGFLAGFRWDFAQALSILVPQLENSLRHILAQSGVEVTTRDKIGLQTVIPLGAILSKAELQPMLGENYIRELKVLFTDQHGPDLRNRIAHGMMSHNEYLSFSAIYAWWFVLFLCINPVYRRFANGAHTDEAESQNEQQNLGEEQ